MNKLGKLSASAVGSHVPQRIVWIATSATYDSIMQVDNNGEIMGLDRASASKRLKACIQDVSKYAMISVFFS